jgi:TP901 family phage tail tape measure protein
MARDIIADLVAQISIDGTKFDKGMGQVNRQLKTVREELKTASSRFRQTGDNADFLASKTQTLSGKLKLQKTQVELLNKAYNESVNNTGEFSKQSQNLATKLERAKRGLMETESELKDVNEQLRNLPNRWQVAAQQAEAAGEKMMNAGRKMTSFGRNMTFGVTLPIATAAGTVLKMAIDWETAFTGVEKTVDATEQQLANLSTGIRNMAKDIPASTTEIAAVAEAAGQLGIQVDNIEEFTRVMIDLGNTTNLTADQAATTFARFANIVGMSQTDFDRLGATLVDLGNNLATTEAEITEMALRLAGAGKQIGLSESQILAFAAALSSVGIEAEAGGSSFSKVMVNIQLAAEKGGKDLKAFAKVAGMSASEFKKAYEKDATSAIMAFIKGLSTAEERGLSAIGILDDMGISEIRMRDALLRAAGASDTFSKAIDIGSNAWEENTALTNEAGKRYETTASQMEVFWNRLKDTGITLGEVLVPALIDALDAAEPLIKQIESGAKAFSEMDEEQQRTILKLIALAAAIGPASMALGGLTTTIGGVVKFGGTLLGLLGRVGGVGLLGRIASLGVSGPVGLAIAGITGMSMAIKYLKDDTKDLYDATFDKVHQMQEEIQATDELITKFEEMQKQNRLTSDEMLEYMDILDDLSSTNAPKKIEELKDRQAELLEKSGFTNDEMNEFLGLNDKIIQQAPNAAQAISEQGNAYADNLQKLKDLNAEKREQMLLEAEMQIQEGLRDERDLLAEQVELQREKNQAMKDFQSAHDDYIAKLTTVNELVGERSSLEAEMADLINQGYSIESEKVRAVAEQIALLDDKQVVAEDELKTAKETRSTYEKTLETKEKELEKVNEELKRLDDLKYEYEALWLAHLDLNAEKGQGLKAIDEEIEKQKKLKENLEKNTQEALKNTDEYRNAQKEIDKQIAKLEEAKGELEQINKLAAESPYEKKIQIDTIPDLETLQKELTTPLKRQLYMDVHGLNAIPMMAEGGFHKGGPFIAGEEGFELGRLGNRWELLNLGMYNRPPGFQVFNHKDSRKILSSLSRIPAYATGINPPGEANRIISGLNEPGTSQPVIIEVNVTSEMDSREVGKGVAKVVTEIQNRNQIREYRAKGRTT